MTKRLSINCLVGFILCLLGAFVLSMFTGGVEHMHGFARLIYNILWAILVILFLPGPASYLFSRSWPELRKDEANREFMRKHPLKFLVWREVRHEVSDVQH
ncbi:hypothetical protein CO659_21115 [Rhizobium sp. S9]|nr:hypothetical protein CO659_21115 [Rhizobium sp. S9]